MSKKERTVMKQCCGLCPFSRKATLPVHPSRAAEFAYSAENPFNDFVCHKTGVTVDGDGDDSGNIVRGEKSLTCAGFHALQVNVIGGESEIDITEEHFEDAWDMIDHHQELHDKKQDEIRARKLANDNGEEIRHA